MMVDRIMTLLRLAHACRHGSVAQRVLHLLGEVEVVFGFWAGVLVALIAVRKDSGSAVAYIDGLELHGASLCRRDHDGRRYQAYQKVSPSVL